MTSLNQRVSGRVVNGSCRLVDVLLFSPIHLSALGTVLGIANQTVVSTVQRVGYIDGWGPLGGDRIPRLCVTGLVSPGIQS